jgi:P-type Ca2+ transporter type 2C
MRDPIRSGVRESIEVAKRDGKVEIRLISADHLETAKAYAIECGIISREALEDPNGFNNSNMRAMDAKEFVDTVGMKEEEVDLKK